MYLWKSWHDSRQRLVVYAVACLVLGVIGGIVHVHWYNQLTATYQRILAHPPHYYFRNGPALDPVQLRRFYLNFVQNSWKDAFYSCWTYIPMAGLWTAFIFGATSVGREYSSGAMSFVLTRPQSRRSVVWQEWALAIAEIYIILVMFYAGALPFALYTMPHDVKLTAIPSMLLVGALAVAACLCGLTQFLTLLTGSSMKGLSAATAVVLFYYFLPSALEVWWHILWPEKVQELSLSVLAQVWVQERSPVLGVTLVWTMLALIFPFLSQWLIEKREV
ncbi:MAG: ABC transporter permease subunit [Terriglobia bacterium]